MSASDPRVADPSALGRTLAWGVHVFTASGAVLGVLALLEIEAGQLARAMVLMLVSLGIDSIDGTLARRVGVARQLPRIDGRRLDDIVDYLNFVIVPAVFMVRAGSVPAPLWVALPVLASAWGFSRRDAKTDDDFFLGFPSYWNVLAFYLWLLGLSPGAGAGWLIGLTVAVFVPYKYVYPSKLSDRTLRWLTNGGGVVWAGAMGWCALRPEAAAHYHALHLSLLYPAFYLALSFKLGGLVRPEDVRRQPRHPRH